MFEPTVQLRRNWYPDGPYLDSVCIHCGRPLRHTGAFGGVTWSPIPSPDDPTPTTELEQARERTAWSTCYDNEVVPHGYGGHEPWEAIPMGPMRRPT